MIKIAPSILGADFSQLGAELETLASADLLHVDIMDGHFVPPVTFGAAVTAAIGRSTRLPLDVHLMMDQPERHLEAFAAAGAQCLTVHAEATVHLHRTLQVTRGLGVKVGVALNPATPLETIEYVLDDVDLVLLMTVDPGFGGQQLIPQTIRKVARLRSLLEGRAHPPEISVDGGVSLSNAAALSAAGAGILVAGSAILGAANRTVAIQRLREVAGGSPSA